MKPKMVILDGKTENPGDLSWEGFEALADVTVYDSTADCEIASRIKDAQIVYTNRTPLNRENILQAPALEFIGVLGTGYNNVDTAAASERGIPVTNVPTYGTEAVAQFVFALLLEICHPQGITTMPFWKDAGRLKAAAFGIILFWSLLEKPWESLVLAGSVRPSGGLRRGLACA